MTLEEKLDQLTLLSDGQMKEPRTPTRPRKPIGAVFSETDPVLINKYQHDAVEQLAAAHPDPVRVRHDPRLPDDLPDPARHGQQLRPEHRADRPPDRRLRVGGGRAQADLQPDGRPLPRASLGTHLRGLGRGPVPQLRDGRGPREGRPGQRLQRSRQGRYEREALRRLWPARGRPRLQHHRDVAHAAVEHVPAAVQGGRRRRGGHGHVRVQRAQRRARVREPLYGDRHHEAALGLRRLHRERLHGRRRAAPVPGREPGGRLVRTRRGGGRQGGGARRP